MGTVLRCARYQAFILDQLQVGEGHGAADGVCRVGEAMHPTPPRRRCIDCCFDSIRNPDPAKRHVATGDTFGKLDDIWLHPPVLQGKPAPGTSETSDDLVADQQHIILVADRTEARKRHA